MSIVYGLKLICEAYFYLSVVAVPGLLENEAFGLFLIPILLGIGAGFSFLRSEKTGKRNYLFLLPTLLVVPFGFGKSEIILMIPMLVYAVFYLKNNSRATDYYYTFRRFRIEVIALLILILFALSIDATGAQSAVSPIFLFLTLSIALLRMLRHEEHIIRQKRFQILNLGGVLAVGGFGALLSQPKVIELIRSAWRLFYTYVLTPIVNVLLGIIELVVKIVSRVISLFPFADSSTEITSSGMQFGASDEAFLASDVQEMVVDPTLRRVLEVIGIVIIAILLFFIIKALSKHEQSTFNGKRNEMREKLDVPTGNLRKQAKELGKSVFGIRQMYVNFLRMTERRGTLLTGRQTSLQIQNQSMDKFDAEALQTLRTAYLRARYGDCADETDLKNAKQAMKLLKEKKQHGESDSRF